MKNLTTVQIRLTKIALLVSKNVFTIGFVAQLKNGTS